MLRLWTNPLTALAHHGDPGLDTVRGGAAARPVAREPTGAPTVLAAAESALASALRTLLVTKAWPSRQCEMKPELAMLATVLLR